MKLLAEIAVDNRPAQEKATLDNKWPNGITMSWVPRSGHKPTLAVILFGPGGLFMSKMPMVQRAEMREGGLPLPSAFQYLILMIPSLASKCQDFKLKGLQFHIIKWLKNRDFNFKVLTFWSQQRYNNQIQIKMSSYYGGYHLQDKS